ncbi:hypothetical protein KNP414_04367 [Paenibacillus mucilaginosus KNP414]|uniref:Uncharacterized protein n=1 Tax=Paenibacillus mucilaginosus (strain KNP414) TaxID=1036673 RepID=F8FJP9_PAEMK|nr:hypothetical protein KNP414_04367 [Paenibacillus mucilaginosus KNP414]
MKLLRYDAGAAFSLRAAHMGRRTGRHVEYFRIKTHRRFNCIVTSNAGAQIRRADG